VNLATNKSEKWKDVTEEINKNGISVKKTGLPIPTSLGINKTQRIWGHRGKALLAKTAKFNSVMLKGTSLACEGCGLESAGQKVVSKTTNTKVTKLCKISFVDGTGPFQTTMLVICTINKLWMTCPELG
jgi:hypothetical protein